VIKRILLNDFRNFKKKGFMFSDGITVIVGPNASGKTNILEALFLLSTGKSFRARIEEEMISYSSEIARIKGTTDTTALEAVLTRGLIDIGNSVPEKVARKKLTVNGVSRRLLDFAGNFKATLFGPWDLDLVTESPSLRRRFLDTVLFLVDREYRRVSLSYDKGLRQRNRLLYKMREDSSLSLGQGVSRSQLLFWNQLLIKNGDYISQKRGELIAFINLTKGLNDQLFQIEYDKSAISETRLEQYAEEEVASATTLVGPHRDDFVFNIASCQAGNMKNRDLSSFGSRGEQRMAVLWLKLAELMFVEAKTGERPTLLLDDIFSELDYEHRKVVTRVSENQQTIITTADKHFLEKLKNFSEVLL